MLGVPSVCYYHYRITGAIQGKELCQGDTIITSMSPLQIANYGAAGGPIFGRERELARLERLVDGVSEHGAALLVRGEPGIGKSTLLAAASQRAEAAGGRGLRTTRGPSQARAAFPGPPP